MRLAAPLRTLAALSFFAFASVAYADPALFRFVHQRAAEGAVWLTLSFLAAGCAARLTLPVSLFGWQGHVSAPLFLALAAPCFLRFMAWRALANTLAGGLRPRPPTPAPARPAAGPYALPARVAVALEAAARARR
jgi:hypothetical protein